MHMVRDIAISFIRYDFSLVRGRSQLRLLQVICEYRSVSPVNKLREDVDLLFKSKWKGDKWQNLELKCQEPVETRASGGGVIQGGDFIDLEVWLL